MLDILKKAERPVLLAGQGIRIAGAQKQFLDVIGSGIPVVSSFCGFDLIPTDHPLFMGRIGTVGNRIGNFALQNADLRSRWVRGTISGRSATSGGLTPEQPRRSSWTSMRPSLKSRP